jgi:hypothetical protein
MITLPTNHDENWRYANLRPLARARLDAVAPGSAHETFNLRPALPGYERWVFVDGHFSARLSAPATDSCATLLNARDAGQAPPRRRARPIRACRCTPGGERACASWNGTSASRAPTRRSTPPSM